MDYNDVTINPQEWKLIITGVDKQIQSFIYMCPNSEAAYLQVSNFKFAGLLVLGDRISFKANSYFMKKQNGIVTEGTLRKTKD
jgi:hypothetical protein